jgi:protein-tyrosine phosphatase
MKPFKKQAEVETISQIDEHLYLGNQHGASNARLVLELNIKHIVELIRMPPEPQLQASVNFLKIPIRGGKRTDVEPVLQPALAFIHAAISHKENVLVHCQHGKNRSASIVIAYLMASKDMRYIEAESYVSKKRPIIEIKLNTKNLLLRFGPNGLRKMMLS